MPERQYGSLRYHATERRLFSTKEKGLNFVKERFQGAWATKDLWNGLSYELFEIKVGD